MLTLYKDLKISYIALVIGVISIFGILTVAGASTYQWLIAYALVLLWVYAHVITATVRFRKIVRDAKENADVKTALDKLYALYKFRKNSRLSLYVAIYIGYFMLQYGRNSKTIELLLAYDPEKLFKRRKHAIYKLMYYNYLSVAYNRLGRKEDALYYNKKAAEVDARLNSVTAKDSELTLEINRLRIVDNPETYDSLLIMLEKQTVGKDLITTLSLRNCIVEILLKLGRTEEAKSHIEFIKQFGGNTVYARCANACDFGMEFSSKIDAEPIEISPKKEKRYVLCVISFAISIILVAAFIFTAANNTQTVYVGHDGVIEVEYTFDKYGKSKYLTMDGTADNDTPGEDLVNQYYYYYSRLNSYPGCYVKIEHRVGEKQRFRLLIDFENVPEDFCETMQLPKAESEFDSYNARFEVPLERYEKILGFKIKKS